MLSVKKAHTMSFLIKCYLFHYSLFIDLGNNAYQRLSVPHQERSINQTLIVTKAALQSLPPVLKISNRFSWYKLNIMNRTILLYMNPV